ncbi:MAG: extracellular solute-binding protein [Pseudomonadota bacterium]
MHTNKSAGFLSVAVLAAGLLVGASASAATLVINSNASDPNVKAAWDTVIDGFKAEHPDIEVQYSIYDHEAYKTAIRTWLPAAPPDVVFWFAGNRMATFVERGLFEDVSDVWRDNGLDEAMASTRPSLTIDGKRWGVPYAYYNWGVYYRKDIFDQYGLSAPTSWDELLAVGKTLKDNGITPVTIGTKYLWTSAGWFDYLNMRTNGLDFHIDLMLGRVAYTDARVRKTFENWRELVDAGFFLENHTSYSWQEAQAPMINGEAAMYLIGNFLVGELSDDVAANIDFFQFPAIDPSLDLGEDAPTETLHIPAKAKNKEDAKRFLAYVARPDVQSALNMALKNLPPHKDAEVSDNRFVQKGAEMLARSKTAQFYDRDTTPEMAQEGMKGFVQFMDNPDDLDEILATLERARQRIFK